MSTTIHLRYGHCPSCTGDALLETTHLLTGDAPPRVRITRIECTNEECLHYLTALQTL